MDLFETRTKPMDFFSLFEFDLSGESSCSVLNKFLAEEYFF